MYFIVIFLTELLILFLLSRQLTRLLLNRFGLRLYAVIFFPGVVLHELSHFFMAMILFVRTGKIDIFPHRTDEGRMQLGSVAIVKTDPIRRLLIGVAPVLVGVGVIVWALFFFPTATFFAPWVRIGTLLILLIEVGNTMFSSRKDMEGALELFLFVGIVVGAAWLVGVRIPGSFVEWFFADPVVAFFKKADVYLLVPISLDVFLLGILRLRSE